MLVSTATIAASVAATTTTIATSMMANDFQFLSGLIEVCIALNVGFAISPAFRNPHRTTYLRKYEAAKNSLELTIRDESSGTDVKKKNGSSKKGADETKSKLNATQLIDLETKKSEAIQGSESLESQLIGYAYLVAGLGTLMLAFVASVPVLETKLKALGNLHDMLYGIVWLCSIGSLLFIGASYWRIQKHWKEMTVEFDKIDNLYAGIKKRISAA